MAHIGIVAHDPVQVVRVQVVHPELKRPQRQPVEITPAPQRVHHESHHQRQVRQKGGKPGRDSEAQLHEDVLDGHLLRTVVELAQLRQQQRK